jgi:hypothetical protein
MDAFLDPGVHSFLPRLLPGTVSNSCENMLDSQLTVSDPIEGVNVRLIYSWLDKACWRRVACAVRRGEIEFLGILLFARMVQQVRTEIGSSCGQVRRKAAVVKSVLHGVALKSPWGRMRCSWPCVSPVCEKESSPALSRRRAGEVLVVMTKAWRPALTDDS